MHIARSRSVPVLNEDISIKRMDSFFRVIPSTPRVKDSDTVSPTNSPTHETSGKKAKIFEQYLHICYALFKLGKE